MVVSGERGGVVVVGAMWGNSGDVVVVVTVVM